MSNANANHYLQQKLEMVKTPNCAIFSLDVECVAVGRTHMTSDRAPAKFALVDGNGKTVCGGLIRPEKPVVSYVTPLSGVRAADFEQASQSNDRIYTTEEAIAELKTHLSPLAI